MSDFYKMDPGAWDFGTASLTLEQEAALLRIVNAMHKHRAPVPNNDRVLAGLFRVSTRKARALVGELVDAGKVYIEDGFIHNNRANSDLVHRGFVSVSRAEIGAKGGRTKAERAAKTLESKDTALAFATPREEKRREEKREVSKDTSAQQARDALCEVATPAAVTSFMAYRAKHKAKALTPTAAKRLAANLRAIFDGGGDPDDALGMAEERGWQTIKPEWYFKEATKNGNGRSAGGSPADDPTLRAIANAARAFDA